MAELCGGEWPARARRAALELSLDVDEAEGYLSVPVIELLRGENVRKGFIAPAEFKSSG